MPLDPDNEFIESDKKNLTGFRDFNYYNGNFQPGVDPLAKNNTFNILTETSTNNFPINEQVSAANYAAYSVGAADSSMYDFPATSAMDIGGTLTNAANSIGNGLLDSVENAAKDVQGMIEAKLGLSPLLSVSPVNGGQGLDKITTQALMVSLTSNMPPYENVTFMVTPTVDESRSAMYDTIQPVHHPGAIQAYKSTSSRAISINGKLIARNIEEANRNIQMMNVIRSWVMPYYGSGTVAEISDPNYKDSLSKMIGAPPPILNFRAYGDKNLGGIPVVLTTYSWTYPDDIDYISTVEGVPCPRILEISLTLLEAYSPEQFSAFNLGAFKRGDLLVAFGGTPPPTLQNSLQTGISSAVSGALGKVKDSVTGVASGAITKVKTTVSDIFS